METQEELLKSLTSWKHLKEVSQVDLDQNLDLATSTPPVDGSENLAQATTEEEGLRSFYAQGIPA